MRGGWELVVYPLSTYVLNRVARLSGAAGIANQATSRGETCNPGRRRLGGGMGMRIACTT